jgi:hypothetical protein
LSKAFDGPTERIAAMMAKFLAEMDFGLPLKL